MLDIKYSPIIICGCHGGGTSFAAKLLRMSGLFLGADSGPVNSRKHHESKIFQLQNCKILEAFGDSNGMIEQVVKYSAANLLDRDTALKISGSIACEELFKSYWGTTQRDVLWGWKDPRNSITFPVWKCIFSGAKAIIISKAVDGRLAKSKSGYWFKNISTKEIRELYMKPKWMEKNMDSLCVSFEELTESSQVFNSVIEFCGLPSVSCLEYRDLLRSANFETDT